MDKHTGLWVIFFISVVMLIDNWQRDHGRSSMFFPKATQTQGAVDRVSGTGVQSTTISKVSRTASLSPTFGVEQTPIVHFSTDVYNGEIDTRGATLSKLTLVKEINGKQSSYITLFEHTEDHTYLARTGLFGGNFPNHNDIFKAVAGQHNLVDNVHSFQISFESPVKGGVKVVKTYTFTRGSYVIGVDTKIENVTETPIKPIYYMEFVRDSQPVETPWFSHTFIGPAVYTNEHHFQKILFSDIDKNKQDYVSSTDNGWIAMVQHYFASAWIPQQGVKRDLYIEKIDPILYRVGVKQSVQVIAPGEAINVPVRLFVGPEEERMLENIAPGLELVKDYGWVTIIAKPLFGLLEIIYNFIGNWGWAIVLLTILIKAIFFPLSAASYRSMARMKEITPRLQALRERFRKSDPQKLNAALVELYKTEKINPFSGCLPVLLQIPVFISLYWVLLSSVEMRGAPWILWIHDLSQPDPYFILPALMALSMFVQTKFNPTSPDPMQAKMMIFIPIVFSVMFFFFPAGLVLYYVVNNILSIIQQWHMTRIIKQK